MPSNALAEFKAAIGVVKALLDLEGTYGDPPPPGERAVVEGLRGGAAILMVAGFECYLSQLLPELLERWQVRRRPARFDRLPDDMKVANVWHTLETALDGPRFGKKGTRASRLDAAAGASQIVAGRSINPAAFGNTMSNPNAERVRAIFKDVGVRDIFRDIKPNFDRRWARATGIPQTASTFLGDTLDAVVSRRHVVAHTASVLNVSRTDLRGSVVFIVTLAESLDVVAGQHLRRVHASAVV